MPRAKSVVTAVAVISAFLWGGSTANADVVTTLVTVRAQALEGQSVVDEAVWSVTVDKTGGSADELYQLASPVTLVGSKVGVLGTIEGLAVKFLGDPVVSVSFAVTAGAVPTAFTFTSAKLTFPVLDTDVVGAASAGVTVTDLDSNGAWLSGAFEGGKAYEALYFTPAQTVFARLVNGAAAGPDDSGTSRGRSGPTPIAGSVSGIQAAFSFVLSANDMGSGTSSFNVTGTSGGPPVVPLPPAVWSGMAMMGLVVGARVRRYLRK